MVTVSRVAPLWLSAFVYFYKERRYEWHGGIRAFPLCSQLNFCTGEARGEGHGFRFAYFLGVLGRQQELWRIFLFKGEIMNLK